MGRESRMGAAFDYPDVGYTGYVQIIRDVREIAIFEGRRYYRYPESPKDSHRKYFQRPGKSLHVAVWESAHGPVPAGHEVHHADHDTLNNDVTNLDCVPISAHRAESAASRMQVDLTCAQCGKGFVGTNSARSERRFCGKRCKQRWANKNVYRVERTCEVCGATFMANRYKAGTCCTLSCAGRKGAKRWEARA
jgi:endogenous inhibitor of DNA gyrase (YacG/DUF329 family)